MKIRLLIVLILLTLSLSACFRDAGNGNANPTRVDVADIFPTATATRRPATQPPTFTPSNPATATEEPPVGGPPVEETLEEEDGTATIFVPSFTPNPNATIAPPSLGGSSGTPTLIMGPTSTLSTLQPTPTEVETEEPDCIYVVQAGDTLFRIAQNIDTELFPEDFIAVNPELAANPDSLYLGQELRIPGCVPEIDGTVVPGTSTTPSTGTPAVTANPNLPAGYQIYVVQEGDTLFSIAFSFGVTVQDVVDATDFLINENTIIHAGDELVIPPAE